MSKDYSIDIKKQKNMYKEDWTSESAVANSLSRKLYKTGCSFCSEERWTLPIELEQTMMDLEISLTVLRN